MFALYILADSRPQLHRVWIKSGNLYGNLVGSIAETVLRDVLIAMIAGKPSLLWLVETSAPADGRTSTPAPTSGKDGGVGVQEAGSNVAKVLTLLVKQVDVVHLHLNEESTLASVGSIWRGDRDALPGPTILVFSSSGNLKQSVEYALLDLLRCGRVTVGSKVSEDGNCLLFSLEFILCLEVKHYFL